MPIDVEQRNSPGWWMKRLLFQLNDRNRRQRLWKLHNYYAGSPPMPEGAEAARESFEALHSRWNFAELITSAGSERMTPVGFRTARDADVTGDAEAAAVWERAGLSVVASDTHNKMLWLHESYVIVGELDDETGAPLITAEDPRTMVGEADPGNPSRLRAAIKVLHDDADEQDRIYPYLPGEVVVASRKQRTRRWAATPDALPMLSSALGIHFDPRGCDIDENCSGRLVPGCPASSATRQSPAEPVSQAGGSMARSTPPTARASPCRSAFPARRAGQQGVDLRRIGALVRHVGLVAASAAACLIGGDPGHPRRPAIGGRAWRAAGSGVDVVAPAQSSQQVRSVRCPPTGVPAHPVRPRCPSRPEPSPPCWSAERASASR
ncbi:hypothetical protein [Micromonospora sp. NBC_00858]|uniref:hypothetical protein n=1 Tax=Micromonospora sp. NBC_00858 TaxID=2975979 RepID=UPI00386A041B|nr:hypothetical protein OG990_15920 [Micromonospora sp. NBC_00858]